MKTYDDSTKLEVLDPDLTLGYVYDGYIVTGTVKVVMNGTVTADRPEGLSHVEPVREPCKWYHAYTAEEVKARKQGKLAEISNSCNAAIENGSDVQLSDGSTEHFSYSLEDQSNISEMFNAVLVGADAYLYHADNGFCMMYSATDIVRIYSTLSGMKTGQLTYHNLLKQYVQTLEKVPDLDAVTYGQPLTGEYLSTYNSLMESANAEMNKILAKVASNVG